MSSKVIFIMSFLFIYTLVSPKNKEEVMLSPLCEIKRDLNHKLDETSKIYSDLMSDSTVIEQLQSF